MAITKAKPTFKGPPTGRVKSTNFTGAKITDAPDWHATPGTFMAGQEEIDELDKLAIEMEGKWGCDRLRMLVPIDLREKFDRQRYLTNQAIWHGDLEDVRQQSRRMMAAWRAADRVAEASDAQPIDPVVWEVVLADGTVAALVRSNDDAHHVAAEGRFVQIFCLDEIGHMISAFPNIARAKQVFPGATVTSVRTNIGDPLRKVYDSKQKIDDPMPF